MSIGDQNSDRYAKTTEFPQNLIYLGFQLPFLELVSPEIAATLSIEMVWQYEHESSCCYIQYLYSVARWFKEGGIITHGPTKSEAICGPEQQKTRSDLEPAENLKKLLFTSKFI